MNLNISAIFVTVPLIALLLGACGGTAVHSPLVSPETAGEKSTVSESVMLSQTIASFRLRSIRLRANS